MRFFPAGEGANITSRRECNFCIPGCSMLHAKMVFYRSHIEHGFWLSARRLIHRMFYSGNLRKVMRKRIPPYMGDGGVLICLGSCLAPGVRDIGSGLVPGDGSPVGKK